MADSQVVVEELWARIRERLAQVSAPEGGWSRESLSTDVRSALTNAGTAYTAVSSAVSSINSANGGKILRVGAGGNIAVPDPVNETDPTPQAWVLARITQAIDEYSHQASSPVTSINGKTGAVTLGAADVGAREAGAPLPIADITGLQSALAERATVTQVNALDSGIPGRVSAAIDSALGPVNNSLSSINGKVGTLESQLSAIERKPSGGWAKSDLASDIQYQISRVESATINRTGETIPIRNTAGTFQIGEPTALSHPTTKKYVDDSLAGKADTATVTALSSRVNEKADTSVVNTVSSDLSALTSRVAGTETSLAKKIELDAGGKLASSTIPTLPISQTVGLQDALDARPLLESGKLPVSTIPSGIPQSSISGLSNTFAGKADLVSGKIPTSQIPAIATHETYPVSSKSAMLALTTSQVQIGDVAIITTPGADQGTYTLTASNPALESSWTRHQAPQDTVLSVNGKSGTVVLSAGDVGARALGSPIVQGDVTGLTTALNDRATKVYVDGELAKKTTPSDVTSIVATLGSNKQAVDLVATTNQLTLSGLKSVDGVLMQAGQRVLLTAQQASSANGIWVVGTGEWTRSADMPSGSTLISGTSVVVKKGTENAQSIWQLANTGTIVVGTGGQQWTKSYSGKDQLLYTAGNGIQVNDLTVSVKLGQSSGLIADSAGLRLDPSSAVRKVSLTVPSGSTVATLTHNLGTNDVSVSFIDNASQEAVLVPWVVVNANAISCEFANAVTSGQYRAVIIG